MEIKNICCIGAGYVGGPTMAVIAEKCPDIKVTLVDHDIDKISAWNGDLDNLPVYEPGLKEIIGRVRGKNLFFSNRIDENIKKSEMIFIAVNTPTKKTGKGAGMAADLKHVVACTKQIAESSISDKIVVEKSTLPVRTAEKVKDILNKFGKKGVNFEILSNPEFLAEGTAIKDLYKSDRVLIGGDETKSGQKAVNKLVKIYNKWIPKSKILTTNIWSSELSKLASNAMLAQRISSINSLSAICEKTGADIDELSKAIGMDHRIGPHFLKASVGFGGSCFQKDILNLVYLCRHYDLNEVADFWLNIIKINDYQKNRFAEKIINHFRGDLKHKKVVILGWAFKANTNDSRESAAIYVVEKLYKAGAKLEIYDPKVSQDTIYKDIKLYWNNKFSKSAIRNIKIIESRKNLDLKVDAVAILTEWKEFTEYNWQDIILKMKNPVKIFDGRNILNIKSSNHYEKL